MERGIKKTTLFSLLWSKKCGFYAKPRKKQPDAVRYLWYLFYLPMLFVPMLALLIAMSLGKPNEYKFPKRMSVLWIISGVLLLLVLTNDLHQFVFTFPMDTAVWTDKNNGYSIGYFIIVGWQVLCAFAALVIMFFKLPTSLSKTKRLNLTIVSGRKKNISCANTVTNCTSREPIALPFTPSSILATNI